METMTRKRKASGLKRPNPIQISFTDDELEFIGRHCYDIDESASAYGRKRMLPRDWKERLVELREIQNHAPLSDLDGRRKNV
jgi:hypothetical protein